MHNYDVIGTNVVYDNTCSCKSVGMTAVKVDLVTPTISTIPTV